MSTANADEAKHLHTRQASKSRDQLARQAAESKAVIGCAMQFTRETHGMLTVHDECIALLCRSDRCSPCSANNIRSRSIRGKHFFWGYFGRLRFDSMADKEYVFAWYTSPVCGCFMVFALISIDDRAMTQLALSVDYHDEFIERKSGPCIPETTRTCKEEKDISKDSHNKLEHSQIGMECCKTATTRTSKDSFVPDDFTERYLSGISALLEPELHLTLTTGELTCARMRFLFQHIRYPKPNVAANIISMRRRA
ncbi:hypothetical protein EAG_03027 [Camponotus floridanus]|uniref:Uncharacterized protein n=1 Tax=Camponotus floridanus TaxID=104421 RepID=E2ARM3_CAMFO|nr:hypothetical protein EAG_03027 [Camponotus floridanus]